jgi:hypothetical protein
MFDPQEPNRALVDGATGPMTEIPTGHDSPPNGNDTAPVAANPQVTGTESAAADAVLVPEDVNAHDQRSEAGRKGAYRVHQLIREGKLYEHEHGLKRGRQRLRQLIELGKLYEQEHGLRAPRTKPRRERLSRTDREDVLATFLRCLVRLAKPSFRVKLLELSKRLREVPTDEAA